jgi:hypothetical protein
MPVNPRISLEDEPSRLWLLLKIASTLNISSKSDQTILTIVQSDEIEHSSVLFRTASSGPDSFAQNMSGWLHPDSLSIEAPSGIIILTIL